MKKLFVLFIANFCFVLIANAQNCSSYMPLEKGVSFEMETYNSSDKKISSATYLIKEVNAISGGKEALLYTEVFDKKGKKESEAEFKIICKGDKVYLDMKNMLMASGALEAYKNMDARIEGDFLEIPENLSVGKSLADGSMVVYITDKSTQADFVKMNMNIVNRKVESKESITVPSGTYNAFKVTYDMVMETEVMGMKMPGGKFMTVEYLSQGVGMVRNESYNKNGKLTGYTVLSKFSR